MDSVHACAQRIEHYGRKCEQHLNRDRLSHLLSLAAVETGRTSADARVGKLIRASFDESGLGDRDEKLRRGFHEIHLVSLKADFELYLNRVLSAIWTAHFASLANSVPEERRVPLQDVAQAIARHSEAIPAAREFVIEQVVPRHGLTRLADALAETTGIDLRKLLNKQEFTLWPQIQVAFEVRHLVEHRDGRVDKEFRSKVRKVWSNSTWSRIDLERVNKIIVEDRDVDRTHEAMVTACRTLTGGLLSWNAAQTTGRADFAASSRPSA